MDFVVAPEVANPVPQISTEERPDRVEADAESIDNGDLSRNSSTARFGERQPLTELKSDDIFRMKGLRPSESVSASEVAEQSVSVFDANADEDTFASERTANDRPNVTNLLFDPEASRDQDGQLNEEDIFRMKSLSLSRADALSEQAGQSAQSQVDSTSNFEEHVADDDENQPDNENAEENEDADVLPQTDLTFSGHFVFNRNRREEPKLNKNTVVELLYPFDTLGQPPAGIRSDEYVKLFRMSKVYLVGTAHFSLASCEDVKKAVAETQPDAIFVELCQSRMSILSLDEETLLREAKLLNREKVMAIVRENGLVQGLLQVLLLSISAHITSQLGLAPGGEFRAAHRASFHVQGCRLVLGDRPVQITLRRALSSLGFFQRLRLVSHVILSNFQNITIDDVEKCKDKDLLESLLSEMAGEFPQLTKIFVEERDAFMTHVLHTIMQKYTADKIAAWANCRDRVAYQPLNIVAVVGLGHIRGISDHWNRHIDHESLLTIPEPSRLSKFIRLGIKVAFIGAVGYGVFRVGRFSLTKAGILRAK